MIKITKLDGLTLDFEGTASKIIDAAWPGQSEMFRSCLAAQRTAPHIANAFYVVATDSQTENAVGFCMSEDSNLSSELRTITWLVVDPRDQAKGVGRRLVEECIEDAKQRRKDILVGTVVPVFFNKLGFHRIGGYADMNRTIMQYKV